MERSTKPMYYNPSYPTDDIWSLGILLAVDTTANLSRWSFSILTRNDGSTEPMYSGTYNPSYPAEILVYRRLI
jgi:hypothetical protein